jgi:hypothetical protein
MNNHKLVMISIFCIFLKYETTAFLFFYKNMLGKPLGFSCMLENKIFFIFVCFLKEETN